jgi:dihydroxyacid dehydratase/phosphogluconate dehydratase
LTLRNQGASHGIMIGHVVPEAATGGPLALVQNGDMISINITTRLLTLEVAEFVGSFAYSIRDCITVVMFWPREL